MFTRAKHPSFASQLALFDVTKRYGDRLVLDRVSFSVRPGEKAGVIGDNGSGKSTLLRLLAGVERPDNGALVVEAPGGIGYLPQTLGLPGHATVQDAIDLALADLRDLEARMREAEAALGTAGEAGLAAYGELVDRYEARGGYEADTRVEIALHGLGQPGLDRDRPLGTLSGGQRSRLALAATLASAPELMLLDEPTNDLDDEAVAWLEDHLRRHRGTVIAITHDRVFLDRVTSSILEVDQRTVRRYGDGYAGYLAAKAAERARQAREHEEWRIEVARNRELVEANAVRLHAIPRKLPKAGMGVGQFRPRNRDHGAMGRIRQAKDRVRHLTENPVAPPPEPLRFSARVSAGEPAVVELSDVVVEGRLRVEALRVEPGSRVLVTGPNGAGKSTLLRVLAGELRPARGTVRRPARVGLLRQDDGHETTPRTLLGAFAAGRPGPPEEHAGELLSLGLFREPDLRVPVTALSAGQRRRLDLARLVTSETDLLLLDEPTNHLSPALVEELEQALASYEGTIVLVTHDRRLRAAFDGVRVHLAEGRLTA
ncbi:TlrC/CarA/OleB/SrmB family ABC-F type ribosomal protection protein [Bailinhaonella thermotolerans]|uniref:TlrC/CarA/OleB/SrmB family ABC-F type ribosomal protection protein n=1 Tax=Bailinhaonella thermotolerans TaxID=1070861 RepID=A0A3A4AMS4_9ACTN|nr:TlrC/CarA/OleB/SrmB family ABC-F type ribosomal protection protein [Bailinhaonella thermotolerans]RJL22543.1 TlrC/CarA/OleB/SrmB family ABC-F type ribosomal protection protein [Bailinhaonella thermotolerans]